jgi:Aminoglycoside-2''-adenylyltransferase
VIARSRRSTLEQLAALADVDRSFERGRIEYWLFGGWAVDFHAGAITRTHADIDLAVWLADHGKIAELMGAGGWTHVPERDEDGSTGYRRGEVRIELAFLARDGDGDVYTPLRHGRARWAAGAFGGDVAELQGVRARVIGLEALRNEKAQDREDPVAIAKDRADLRTLSRL